MRLIPSLSKYAEKPTNGTYWQNLQIIALILPLNHVASIAATLILIISWLAKRGLYSLASPVAIGWLGWTIWTTIVTVISPNPARAALGLVEFIPFLVFFAISSCIVRTFARLSQITRLICLSTAPVSIFSILQTFLNRPDWTIPRLFNSYTIPLGTDIQGRTTSIFGHFNEGGLYLAMCLPLLIHYSINSLSGPSRPDLTWLFRVLLLSSVIGIFTSGSRNAWGLALIAVAISAFLYIRIRQLLCICSVILCISLGVISPMTSIPGRFLYDNVYNRAIGRLSSTVDPSSPDFASTSNRINVWKISIQLIEKRPLQGWGFNNFDAASDTLGRDRRGLPHEHNNYLMLAVATGIPGLIGYLVLMAMTISACLRCHLPYQSKLLLLSSLTGACLMLLSGILDIITYEPRVHILGWLLLGVSYGISGKAKVNKSRVG